jgi:flavin reductase (DIM6/NTAB) family NADH-FMN oxidoreductase RutF
MPAEPIGPVEPEAYRAVAARLAGTVCVVTVRWRGAVHATTVSSVASVSLEPPMVLFCVHGDARLADALAEVDSWTLSVLAADQAPVADWLASAGRPVVGQLERVAHEVSPLTGAARVAGAAAWFDARTAARHPAGDHDIVVGEVLAASAGTGAGALAHVGGRLRPIL